MLTSYNRVNGTHVSEDPFLLTKILRNEWKFDGMVSLLLSSQYVFTANLRMRFRS